MSVHKVIEPLHVAVIGGHSLRFFRTPLNDGRPDLPWVAIDDLGRCLGLSRTDRRVHLRAVHAGSKAIIRTIATSDGPASIIPVSLANAAAAALVEDLGRGPAQARAEYQRAASHALMKLSPGPFPSIEALMAWTNAVTTRWGGDPMPAAELLPFVSVTTADGDESRMIDEREMLLLAKRTEPTDGNKIAAVQNEIVEIVRAWHRGELLPRSDAPLLSQIYAKGFTP
jgi:hypothetical protein